MNTETQKIDVLEVMDSAANVVHFWKGKDEAAKVRKASAAVAALIAQAEEAQIKLQGYAHLLRKHGLDGAADEAEADAANVRGALARVGGVA